MSVYAGVHRQRGGSLGGIFRVLGRQILPAILKTAKPLLKSTARRALPHIANAGLGLVGDLAGKKNFKGAVRSRGKRLASEMLGSLLNTSGGANKRQKSSGIRPKQTSRRAPARKRKQTPKRRKKASRDVFS